MSEQTLQLTQSGLQFQDLVVGDGEEAKVGQNVSVHYTGVLKDGEKFDSSLDRGTPFNFALGAGMVIRGWDEGVQGMRVGGKRKLVIPPDLAYGKRGAGGGRTHRFLSAHSILEKINSRGIARSCTNVTT